MDNQILEKLANIESLLLSQKKVFNSDELSEYTGYSKSTIYKMVQANILPFSKPNGKHIFFDKGDIDNWLLSNKSKSKQQSKSLAKVIASKTKKEFNSQLNSFKY